MQVQSLALLSALRSGVTSSCDAGHRRGSDPSLLWQWDRPAAVTQIRPLGLGHGPKKTNQKTPQNFRLTNLFFFFFFFFFGLFRSETAAYVGSQTRGTIGATAAGLYHSHSNAGSRLHLRSTPQLMAMPDPWPTEQGQESNLRPHGH